MPNIKPELKSKRERFLYSAEGEFLLVSLANAVVWAISAMVFARITLFISDTLYPFTYPFFHTPIHGFLPRLTVKPSFWANLIFGAVFGYAIYRFEKNILYRRLNKAIRAAVDAVAACIYVFISELLAFADESAGLGLIAPFMLRADAKELPLLFIYYFFAFLCIISLCNTIRRMVYLLP